MAGSQEREDGSFKTVKNSQYNLNLHPPSSSFHPPAITHSQFFH